jgi:hypothetical protein
MADTAALKAAASQRRAGSRPAPGTRSIPNTALPVFRLAEGNSDGRAELRRGVTGDRDAYVELVGVFVVAQFEVEGVEEPTLPILGQPASDAV